MSVAAPVQSRSVDCDCRDEERSVPDLASLGCRGYMLEGLFFGLVPISSWESLKTNLRMSRSAYKIHYKHLYVYDIKI